MNDNELEKLKEAAWRNDLSPAEEQSLQQWLQDRNARAQWDEETRLSQILQKLPNVPISSNFVSQVVQRVERESADFQRTSRSPWDWMRRNWLPRIAIASLVIGVGIFSLQYSRQAELAEIAQGVAELSTTTSIPQEWLQDFEAINRLSPPAVDDELLLALQ